MQLWSAEHAATLIPAVVLMIVAAALLRLWLGKKEIGVRMIPFQILAVAIVLLEIGKQAVSLSRGYDLYHLPFHFCSLFIFSLPAMAFYKGKHRGLVRGVTASLCGAMTLLLLIYPCLIYSAWDIQNYFRDYMAFHTVTFHNIVVFAFILIVALNLHTPQPKGEKKVLSLFTVGFCMTAALMSQLLQTNYANFYQCNIPPLENLRLAVREAVGAVPAQILYVLIVTVLHILFVQMCYWLYRRLRGVFVKPKMAV